MHSSFLLLTCTVDKNIEVANELQKIGGIEEAIPVYGSYDCVVKTEKMPPEDVVELVSSTVRFLDNVHTVLTLYSAPPKFIQDLNVG